MAITTLIFDLGNVLVTFSHEKMFQQIGKVVGASSEAVRELLIDQRIALQLERGLLSVDEIYTLFKNLGTTPFQLDHLLYAASNIFTPRKEMETLVKTLKAKGYQLLILSNTYAPHIDFISQNMQLLSLFDHLILSYEIGAAKPEETIYRAALQKAATSPNNCFYIDDIVENIRAAEKLGITSHHFTSHPSLMESLIQHAIL